MNKSKLLKIIKAMDSKEMYRLDAFLRSPYFYPRGIPTNELRLFELLHHYHPRFPDAQLKKETIFQQLFPGRLYTKGVLDKKMSSLLKQIERYIFYEDLDTSNNEARRLMGMSRFLRKKNLTQLYEKNLDRIRKTQDNIKKKGIENFLQEFQIQQEKNEYKGVHNELWSDSNFGNTLKALDDFRLAYKLYHTCNFLFHNLFHNQVELHDDSLLLENIDPIVQKTSFAELPIIKIYTLIFLILQKGKEDDSYFKNLEQLEQIIELHEDQLSFKLLKEIHAFLRSFYLWQYNNGNLNLLRKIFNLYRDHLAKGSLFSEGGLHNIIYRNIVSYGLKLKEYDWTYLFIEQYKDKIIGTNYPQNVYHFNLADYYFRIKDYEKAKSYLIEDKIDLFHQKSIKRLEIKIYFEEKSILSDSKIEPFRLFIFRLSKKKLFTSTNQIEANNNFVKLLKQIIHPKTYNNPTRIKKLREKILSTKVLVEKDWLLEKLDE